ncbi:hypothetical protein JB92DRAFT_1543359 [Gautieria morchelliformis]|nr:hypothetical protein JB92DRAFT_1543359 [Gautieria morchelliformis]
MRYEPVPNPSEEPVDEDPEDVDPNDEANDSELQPLVPTRHARGSPAHKPLSRHFTNTAQSHNNHLLVPHGITPTPATPASSDGVFANIPAKPTSSRDRRIAEDEELGEDEWIFMTPEQRMKLAPPKYSKIKRDRAPRYTTEYTPPAMTIGAGTGTLKSRRSPDVRPRVNSLPAGSSKLFFVSAVICTLLPFLGYFIMYLANGRRWRSHAARLGSRLGMGLGLFHLGAMMFYIPALLPAFVGLPFGWRISRHATREYSWLKAEERVLLERIIQMNLAVAADDEGAVEGCEEDVENGHRYIEGTDIRVRDLRKILAKARDARLARSLRAAGF